MTAGTLYRHYADKYLTTGKRMTVGCYEAYKIKITENCEVGGNKA
jgi:hypothetical protein